MIKRQALEILTSKPERISNIEPGLEKHLRARIGGGRAALVELSGRDSIAAGTAAALNGYYDFLIPTIVYTGTEYGDWGVLLSNAEALGELVRKRSRRRVQVLDTVIIGSPSWWHAVGARFAGELFRLYGVLTTCVACHMYFHASRVPLARALGAEAIIGGERESHDGRLKLNQLEAALAAYHEVLSLEGLKLDLPLAKITEGKRIQDITGPGWVESERQMRCTWEGSYRDAGGKIIGDTADLDSYLDEFLSPVTTGILKSFSQSRVSPDYQAIAGEVLSRSMKRRYD